MNEIDEIRELHELQQTRKKLDRRETILLRRISERIRQLSSDPSELKFDSKISAIEHVIRTRGSPMHVRDITIDIEKFGFVTETKTISGMLRKYARENKKFTAEGGNRFGLIEWTEK